MTPENRAPNYLDASQYFSWMLCPHKWAERYINRVQKSFPSDRQRDDSLAIGSLTHAGLENWYTNGVPEIPRSVVDEIGPTPEAYELCNALLQGYVRTYPVEPWELVACEEPLRAKLIESKAPGTCSEWPGCKECCDEDAHEVVGCDLLAKVDSYFKVPVQMELPSGVDEFPLNLTPGFWAQEFKTKAASVDRAKWIRGWVTNMQASFQILTLREKLRGEDLSVQGVLVSVLEKPKPYIPKRKCKGCSETYEMTSWAEVPNTPLFACPGCQHQQALKPYEPKTVATPSYFRFTVTRTEEELEIAFERAKHLAGEMEKVRSGAVNPRLLANTTACNGGWFGQCEFFGPHVYDYEASTADGFERTRDYIGESVLVEIEL